MSEGSKSERQHVEEADASDETLLFQSFSDYEESTDEECFGTTENLLGNESSSADAKNLKPGFSSEIAGLTTVAESSNTDKEVQIEKCSDVLECSIKDSHSSSGESKSLTGSTELSYIIEYGATEEGDIDDYVCVDIVDAIEEKDIIKLLQKSRVDHYSAKSSKVDPILAKCRMLFERDYVCKEVYNYGGSLCNHYPVRIIVPVSTTQSEGSIGVEFDTESYTNLVKSSVSCRLRKRFVVPVIVLGNQFICRAGTITVRKTAVIETSMRSPSPKARSVDDSPIKQAARNLARAVCDVSSRSKEAMTQLLLPGSILKLRDVDAQILRNLNINYICDLMIEDRKKYKHIRLSSSEKINPDIYRDCNIEQMPYPGCQFFKRYNAANRVPEGLVFNWQRSDVNSEVKLTEDPNISFPDIEWEDYKEWDVIDLTKNYMKVLLSYLARGQSGLLVHCISGWDRTPLFISILRISLWADGVIHKCLNCTEMAYLTLAYDWYLFGHDLPSRLKKKEEIMHFCFRFLPYIASDEFSITRIYHELPPELKENSSLLAFEPGRRSVLNEISSYVLKIYDSLLTGMIG